MVCFDTCIIIWGLQNTTYTPGGETDLNILRVQAYIEKLAEEKEIIMVPLPAIAEYLVGIPATDHHIEIEKFHRLFQVQTLTDQAASTL